MDYLLKKMDNLVIPASLFPAGGAYGIATSIYFWYYCAR